jgi:tRNA (mo5U34)-methyltransferase
VAAQSGEGALTAAQVQAQLDALAWYHTIDVVPGATTKGWWDLRHALDVIPFPDVRGKRCLDVGTWDGFYAYELERRGAAEVIALDVPDLSAIDYPPEVRADTTYDHSQSGTQPRSAGFHLIHKLRGSKVEWRGVNIYDLDPAELGQFDLVVVGSLLLHLRDPVRALDAVRRVTAGELLSVDSVDARLSLLSRRRPLFELRGETADFQWWIPSEAGLRHLLHVGGFDVERSSRPFLLRPGPTLRPSSRRRGRDHARRLLHWTMTRDTNPDGHVHRAHLARPRF